MMMLAGAVMVPVGLGVSLGNAFEKCDPEGFGVGPCSETEPNKTAYNAGLGAMMGGTMLFLAGILTIATD